MWRRGDLALNPIHRIYDFDVTINCASFTYAENPTACNDTMTRSLSNVIAGLQQWSLIAVDLLFFLF